MTPVHHQGLDPMISNDNDAGAFAMVESRIEFENNVVILFAAIRACKLAMKDDNGSSATRAALCWRREDGRYGVAQVEAAWWGWRTAKGFQSALSVKE